MAGLVPAISMIEARPPPKHVETPCSHYRDRRDKPGDDVCGASISSEHSHQRSRSLGATCSPTLLNQYMRQHIFSGSDTRRTGLNKIIRPRLGGNLISG